MCIRGEKNGNTSQYSCLENPVDRGAWWAAVHRVAQRRTRLMWLSMHACIGEGNGNPLQWSCLENPRDGGAWWAVVYGVAQSWTRLKRLSGSSSSVHMSIPISQFISSLISPLVIISFFFFLYICNPIFSFVGKFICTLFFFFFSDSTYKHLDTDQAFHFQKWEPWHQYKQINMLAIGEGV